MIVAQWVADRYVQLAVKRFKHLRKFGQLMVPATITAGTVTATRDSNTMKLDATAQAALAADPYLTTNPIAGRWIRPSVSWYRIKTYVAPTITLDTNVKFAEDDVSGGGYTIAARTVPLDATARWIDDVMVSMRRRTPVYKRNWSELDNESPDRSSVGDVAFAWHEAEHTNGVVSVELYPYCNTSEMYIYTWWPVPPSLAITDNIPTEIDAHVLREGAMIDAMRRKMAELLNTKPLTQEAIAAAATWRNDYRAQQTYWDGRVSRDAYMTDSAADDKTFVLQRGSYQPIEADLRTAYDQVLATWRS